LRELEEFLVAWIQQDIDKNPAKHHYYPSQDLDILLDWFLDFSDSLRERLHVEEENWKTIHSSKIRSDTALAFTHGRRKLMEQMLG
jgi:hypothetical protein